jgi:hypothetical protein
MDGNKVMMHKLYCKQWRHQLKKQIIISSSSEICSQQENQKHNIGNLEYTALSPTGPLTQVVTFTRRSTGETMPGCKPTTSLALLFRNGCNNDVQPTLHLWCLAGICVAKPLQATTCAEQTTVVRQWSTNTSSGKKKNWCKEIIRFYSRMDLADYVTINYLPLWRLTALRKINTHYLFFANVWQQSTIISQISQEYILVLS